MSEKTLHDVNELKQALMKDSNRATFLATKFIDPDTSLDESELQLLERNRIEENWQKIYEITKVENPSVAQLIEDTLLWPNFRRKP